MDVVTNICIHYLEERVKVPWPVSEREALLHYFELEYLKEDLVIVIMKTVRMLNFLGYLFFMNLDPQTSLSMPPVHLFLLIALLQISDMDNINIETHGFSRDGIPEAGDTVRIDVVGGFVLQRITKEKSFFR